MISVRFHLRKKPKTGYSRVRSHLRRKLYAKDLCIKYPTRPWEKEPRALVGFNSAIEELERKYGALMKTYVLPKKMYGRWGTLSETIDVSEYEKEIKQGKRYPIVAELKKDGRYEIIDGHNRYLAYKKLKFKKVPVITQYAGKEK